MWQDKFSLAQGHSVFERNTAIGLLRWAGYRDIAKAGRKLAAQPAQALALIGIAFENE
jgi:hypothetical protein